MAKLTRDEFISSLKEMSILEIKELVDAMKEEFGVDPSAVAVAGPVAAAVEEGPSKVNVVLTAAGANKIAVIKLIRDLTGLGLKEAKEVADNGGNVKEGIDKEEAEKIKVNKQRSPRLPFSEFKGKYILEGFMYGTSCNKTDIFSTVVLPKT